MSYLSRQVVDHLKLYELQDWSFGWRSVIAPELSEVYVPGEGDNPRVLIVGEAPGAQEELKKRPFVGATGQILRELMISVNISTGLTPHFGEPNCWLTNVVHFRPPSNCTPTQAEIDIARHGLRKEWIAVGRPRIIVPVGGVALNAIIGKRLSILKMAGQPIPKLSRDSKYLLYIWPMIHPSFGIRHKSMIPLIEKDWSQFDKWLKQTKALTEVYY